jgi:anti-sigma factor RsiW
MSHLAPETLLDLALELLPRAETEAARTHLEACPECSDSFAALELEQETLHAVAAREPAPPPQLETGILARVRWHTRPGVPRLLVAAAALLVVSLGLFALRPDDPTKVTMLHQVRASELMALGLGEDR